ncbi:MAG: T9SS C-terminal target domain-containing protein [Saprospirales bacterium]|nr:MAG: T9SS C-terminal target domain-containing protein [Saprospirales bacterium]
MDCSKFIMSIDELMSLPPVHYKLAFHLKARPDGYNFTCDPNDPLLDIDLPRPENAKYFYAPLTIGKIVAEMNKRMWDEKMEGRGGVIMPGGNQPMNISFSLAEGGDCGPGIFLYEHGETFQTVPDAMNVFFVHRNVSYAGWADFPGQNFYLNNVLTDLFGPEYFPWWRKGRLSNHEFGHTRRLRHSFHCNNPCNGVDLDADAECYGSCCGGGGSGCACWGGSQQSLTMAYGESIYNFTVCEYEQLWNYIINNPSAYQDFDPCAEDFNGDPYIVDYNGHVVWDQKKMFATDVRIRTGTTLEITCEVHMGRDRYIIVEEGAKLIVNGGKITNLCDVYWRGIKAYGGNTDFDVKITNAAIIENTSAAAVSMFAPEPWPAIQNWGNGILHAENSFFNNTRRMVEFMSWSPMPNSSHIINCVQDGGLWGATNWNCRNILIENTVFKNLERDAVVTEKGNFYLINNSFQSDVNSVRLNHTTVSMPTIMTENVFKSDYTGVNSFGGTFGFHEIHDNIFATEGLIGMFMDGNNTFVATENQFMNILGAAVMNIGSTNHGRHIGNSFGLNYVGLYSDGENKSYSFLGNCFQSTFGDIYIDGTVIPIVGSNNILPANNCFTHNGSLGSPILDITGNINPPFYYVLPPASVNPDCRSLINTSTNVIPLYSQTDPGLPDCAFNNVYEPEMFNCDPDGLGNDLAAAYEYISNLYYSTINPQTKAEIQACYDLIKSMLSGYYAEEGKFDSLRTLYSTSGSDQDFVNIFSSYILENNLNAATNFLSSIDTTEISEPLNDFIIIQEINLTRLPMGPFFIPSGQELDTIYHIANKDHSFATYAKSLYFALTEISINSDIPQFILNGQQYREIKEKTDKEVTIYPNPFRDVLNISTKGYEKLRLIAYDLYGRIIYTSNEFDTNYQVITQNWTPGVYFIVMKEGKKQIFSERIVLFK